MTLLAQTRTLIFPTHLARIDELDVEGLPLPKPPLDAVEGEAWQVAAAFGWHQAHGKWRHVLHRAFQRDVKLDPAHPTNLERRASHLLWALRSGQTVALPMRGVH